MPKYNYPSKAVDLQFSGWETFQQMLSVPHFERMFLKYLSMQNRVTMNLMESKLKQSIKSNMPANSPVTEFVKGSNIPLVDNADLIGNVSGRLSGDKYGFLVGTNRITPGKKMNLAHMLETGWKQKVTEKMRKLFFYWARKSDGKVKPLKPSTTHIIVPPRPYMRNAFFEDRTAGAMFNKSCKQAIHKTYSHFVQQGRATGK